MKNCILKGLCVIFIILSLMAMMIPAIFAAQDGHGGTTEVIAHVAEPAKPQTPTQPPTDSPTEPSDQPVTPADTHPVQTGETVVWLVLLVLLLTAALLLIMRLKLGDHKE